jgi:SPP1 gp7 family putative phage head morphogenesis protein
MSFLLDPVPHKEAADFIKSKPAVSRAVFDRLLPELKARAFTVTGIEDATVLQGIRDRIAELPAGGNWEDIKEDLAENISPFLAKGDTPEDAERAQIAATRRAELLLRLHGFQAYSAAAYQVMDAQRDVFPYWQYKSMSDSKVRDTHAALNGVVLPANAKFWERHYPPWEWGCRCQVVPLMEEDVEEIREAEAGKPLEERKVLEGEALRQIEERGQYVAGPNQIYDLRTPIEKGKPGAFEWSPADLRIPIDGLRERYDAETFAQFETWARGTKISANRSVWQWMEKTLPAPEGLPKRLEGLNLVRKLGGSTGAELYQGTDGRQWVVKRGNSAEHIREEFAADAIYRAMGVAVPEAALIETTSGPVKVAQFIQGQTLGDFLKANPARREEVFARVRGNFVADALMGNWDVAGMGMDNILVDADGLPWRIDNGGSLRFRAQGGRKTDMEWNGTVAEIDSLRDPNRNPVTAGIFAGITPGEILGQVKQVVAARDAVLAAAPPDVRTVLAARLDALEMRLAPPGEITPQFAKEVTSARVLGRTFLGDREQIEDHSILFWQEKDPGGQYLTRAKLRLTEAGYSALQAKIGAVLAAAKPAPATGPAPLPTDKFWPTLKVTLGNVNYHATDGAYSSVKVAQFETMAQDLAKWKPKTADEKAMKKAYEATVADIRKAMAAKAKTAMYEQYLAQPKAQTPATTVPEIEAKLTEMVYEGKVRDRGHAQIGGATVKRVQGAYLITIGDVEITMAPWEKSVDYAHRGMTQIRIKGQATPERIQSALDALKKAGIDAGPTPPATKELLYLRKNLDFAKPGGAWQKIIEGNEPDAAKLTKVKAWVKKNLKIDPDADPNYRPDGRANAWGDGWKVWERFDLPAERIRAELPGWGLTHQVSGSLPEFVSSILDGGGQITPTMERMRIGVPISAGWSPVRDQQTGGANYFFTRIAPPQQVSKHVGLVFKIDRLARMDAFSFIDDVYGDLRPPDENEKIRKIHKSNDPHKARGRTIEDYKKYGTHAYNETDFKNTLSMMDDIEFIRASSPAERQLVLQAFATHGVTHLPDGRKVEDVVK